MKKKLVSVLLCAAMVMTMSAGCGKKEKGTDDAVSSNGGLTTEDITLTVWESSGATQEFIEKAGEEFNKKYPNITIEFVNVEIGDANTQIALDGPAGVGADVFAVPHDQIGGLVSGGHILPAENADLVKENALASCTDAVTYDGEIYGYPISAETYALFYNKDLVKEDEVPKTWEEVKTFAETFNSAGKYAAIWNVSDSYYSPMFTGKSGNRLFGETGTDASKTYMNTAEAVEGMKEFQSMRDSLDVPAADIADNSVCLAAFTSGNAAMYITGPWNVSECENANMNFGVTTLPALAGEDIPSASFAGARTLQISAYTDYPAEAQAFAEFCMSEEMQKERYAITGALPSIDIEVDSEYAQGFIAQLQYAYPTPSIPEMTGFWDSMKSACANIWDGADVQKELDACDKAVLAQ